MTQYYLTQRISNKQFRDAHGIIIPEDTLFSVCFGKHVFEVETKEEALAYIQKLMAERKLSSVLPYLDHDAQTWVKKLWGTRKINYLITYGDSADLLDCSDDMNDIERILLDPDKSMIVYDTEDYLRYNYLKYQNLPNAAKSLKSIDRLMAYLNKFNLDFDDEIEVNKVVKASFFQKIITWFKLKLLSNNEAVI